MQGGTFDLVSVLSVLLCAQKPATLVLLNTFKVIPDLRCVVAIAEQV